MSALPRCVPPQPGETVASRLEAMAARSPGTVRFHSSNGTSAVALRSKVNNATWSDGPAARRIASTRSRAAVHTPSRRMLALVSTSTTERFGCAAAGSLNAFCRKNGRENPSASKSSARQRRSSSSRCSSLWRFESRGGLGCRNMSELNVRFSRVVRRMR